MTNLEFTLIVALLTANGLLLFKLWRDYQIDRSRQLFFEIRDELFASFNRNDLPFDNEAYYLTRTILNGLIRYSHEISFTKFVIASGAESASIQEFQKQFSKALEASTPKAREIVKRAIRRTHETMLMNIIARSTFLQSVQGAAFIAEKTRMLSVRFIISPIRRLEIEAYSRVLEDKDLASQRGPLLAT